MCSPLRTQVVHRCLQSICHFTHIQDNCCRAVAQIAKSCLIRFREFIQLSLLNLPPAASASFVMHGDPSRNVFLREFTTTSRHQGNAAAVRNPAQFDSPHTRKHTTLPLVTCFNLFRSSSTKSVYVAQSCFTFFATMHNVRLLTRLILSKRRKKTQTN